MTTRRQEDDSLAEADLRVNLGTTESGGPAVLDMRAHRGGDGPHGVVVGRCGSERTVLLKSFVDQLAEKDGPGPPTIKVLDPVGSFGLGGAGPSVEVYSPPLDGADDYARRFAEDAKDEMWRRRRSTGMDPARASSAGPPHVLVVDAFDALRAMGKSRGLEELLCFVGRIGGALGMHLLVSCRHAHEIGFLLASYSYLIVFDSDPASSRRLVGAEIAHGLPRGRGLLLSHARGRAITAFAHAGAVWANPEPIRRNNNLRKKA